MALYLIKLFPVENYFFGSDVTFGKDNSVSYLVRSLHFPQQTTLLGMLRYYLLVQNGLLDDNGKINNEEKSEKLIGGKSFRPGNTEKYGIICNLSPVFIIGNDGSYLVHSREHALIEVEDEVTGKKQEQLIRLKVKKRSGKFFHYPNNDSTTLLHDQLFTFEKFNTKKPIPDLLVNPLSDSLRFFEIPDSPVAGIRNEGIFIPDEGVGHRKPKRGEPNEHAFYKQISYRMAKGFGLAFYASLNLDKYKIASGLVTMGGERSEFKVDVTPVTDDRVYFKSFDALAKQTDTNFNEPDRKITLLSDAWMPRSVYEKYVIAALAETVSFGFMETVDYKKGEFKMKRADIGLRKVKTVRTLLRKGSVLFVKNAERKIQLLDILRGEMAEENQDVMKSFYNIGYNYGI